MFNREAPACPHIPVKSVVLSMMKKAWPLLTSLLFSEEPEQLQAALKFNIPPEQVRDGARAFQSLIPLQFPASRSN